jgi:hypothetical protein
MSQGFLFLFLIGILVTVAMILIWRMIVSPYLRERRLHGVGYVVVCASAGSSSQADLIHGLQYLNLLFQKGVPPSRVQALLPRDASPSNNPSPRVGLPPLEIPPEYAAYCGGVLRPTTAFLRRVLHAIWAFAGDPLITAIVLIYINHCEKDSPDALDCATLGSEDLSDFCRAAHKPFLAILDSPSSTPIAEKAMDRLRHVGVFDWVDAGFLTSGRGRSYCSAVLVSTANPELLPLCGDAHFKINNSMFSRSLLVDLAYKLGADAAIRLMGFGLRMNDLGGEMKNGFEADFKSTGGSVAVKPIRFFFPWGPVKDGEMSLLNPTVPFASVIPGKDLGGFMDDIGHFWNGVGSVADYDLTFCDVSVGNDGTMRIDKMGKMRESDPQHSRILEELKKGRTSPPAETRSRRKPVHVPLLPIAGRVCQNLIDRQGGSVRYGIDPDWLSELKEFIEELNGSDERDEGVEGGAIWTICNMSGPIHKEAVRNEIVEARKRIAMWSYIDLEPIEC